MLQYPEQREVRRHREESVQDREKLGNIEREVRRHRKEIVYEKEQLGNMDRKVYRTERS